MKNKKLYNDGYYNGVISIVFQDKEYEVDCEATCNIYYSKYEDGFTETELDGVIPCITSIYDTDEQKYVTTELINNEDFIESVVQALINAFNDGSDDWENIDAKIREQEEENRLYWLCEMAEKDFNC